MRIQYTCQFCAALFLDWPSNHRRFCSSACRSLSYRTHGETSRSGQKPSTEYTIWIAMKKRCFNVASDAYPQYGGRGITVCEAWRNSYERFLFDVGRRPSPSHTLDRIDNDGSYEPGNVRWATRSEQQRNRRVNHVLTLNGVTRCIAEWADVTGIAFHVLSARLKKGWSIERMLNTPVAQRRSRSPS